MEWKLLVSIALALTERRVRVRGGLTVAVGEETVGVLTGGIFELGFRYRCFMTLNGERSAATLSTAYVSGFYSMRPPWKSCVTSDSSGVVGVGR